MGKQEFFISLLSVLLLFSTVLVESLVVMGEKTTVPVGVVLDLNSTFGEMAESCMSIAVSDFYAVNTSYRTRLALVTRDSEGDVVTAASAALDLMKNEEVVAIIGPKRSSEANFIIDLGEKAQVPIVSFSTTSPSLSSTRREYFVRTAIKDSSQVQAMAAIIQTYGWREVVLIYEDTEYGNGLVPYLINAFQQMDPRVNYRRSIIPLSSTDSQIKRELNMLKEKQKSIFLVHMTAFLGSRLFLLAKEAGMMDIGYAWIVTQGCSTLLDPVGANVMDSMQGVIGVRPYVPFTKELKSFVSRRKKLNPKKENHEIYEDGLNLFCLWAYDTVRAIATAVEKADIVNSSFVKQNSNSRNTVDQVGMGVSEIGPRLLSSILKTRFRGLSGEFRLNKGEMVPSAFEIFNVIGNTERVLGYWTSEMGLSRNLDSSARMGHSTVKNKLKSPIWPGDTTQQPKKLRIGVPLRSGFNEFMKVNWNSKKKPDVAGFSHDIFLAVVDALPFPLPYELIPYVNKTKQSAGTYSELLYQIKLQKFDAVVGDTTIVANRSTFVDFSLPYSESGVTMVVLMKPDERENMWIFLKPLSWGLWLTTGLAFILTGMVIWVLEHRINTEFRGSPKQQLATVLWFSFSTLVFAHRERVMNNWTRFVIIIWIFVVLIISQSYTASLASMLTVQRLQPPFVDIQEIQRLGYSVGVQQDSFVTEFLIKQFNFNESKLKRYVTPEDYHDALSKGIHNGGVAAIFDEIPYVKRFLARYCSNYQMVGPIYRTDGFGFAFPIGSPLVPFISRAILNVTEDKDKMEEILSRNFGGGTTCGDNQSTASSAGGLQLSSFGGLFIIAGVASLFSLFMYILGFLYSHWPALSARQQEESLWLRIIELVKQFDTKDLSAQHYKRSDAKVHSLTRGPESTVTSPNPTSDDTQDDPTTNEGVEQVIGDDDHHNLAFENMNNPAHAPN